MMKFLMFLCLTANVVEVETRPLTNLQGNAEILSKVRIRRQNDENETALPPYQSTTKAQSGNDCYFFFFGYLGFGYNNN